MFTRMFRFRLLAALIPALLLSAAAFAFAAANTVPDSGAGDGTGGISGYNITNIKYTLNAANPGNIDSVGFTVQPISGTVTSQPSTVKAQLSGSWYTCAVVTAPNWSCNTTTPPAAVLPATTLRVVASQ